MKVESWRIGKAPLAADGKPNRAVQAILDEIEWFVECSLLVPDTRLQDIADAASEPVRWCFTHNAAPITDLPGTTLVPLAACNLVRDDNAPEPVAWIEDHKWIPDPSCDVSDMVPVRAALLDAEEDIV